jgi:PTH1 family peptidyl-tRNA hydrolase
LKIIAGLGNPGEKYRHTRHNIGFMFIDLLSETFNIPLDRRDSRARWGKGDICSEEVVLLKPQTYMNLSGYSVSRFKDRFDVPLKDIFVIYDDVDLPFEKIRIKTRGGAGGHKGIQSIISSLRSDCFPRLRMGIGRPESDEMVDHVLEPFTLDERKTLKFFLDMARVAMESVIQDGISSAMNKFN